MSLGNLTNDDTRQDRLSLAYELLLKLAQEPCVGETDFVAARKMWPMNSALLFQVDGS